jgi:UDP-glucose 4-epimerase
LKRAIITGATGFVGANLARHLLDAGCQVHLLVRPQYASWRIEDIRTDVQIHVLDLLDTASLECVLKDVRPDWIFHLAVYGAYSAQRELPQMIATNISATANLLHVCLDIGFEAFINTGSSSEYGLKESAPAEDEYIDPNSYYACTKATVTHLCRHLARERGAHITTLRLYSAYGPYEDPQRLLPKLALCGMRRRLPPLVAPATARDFVYVEDVCRAYMLAVTQPQTEHGAIYNVGTGVQTTLEEAVRQVREICQIAELPQWGSMANRQWDAQTWVADNSKIKSVLGWEPECDFAEGFHRTMAWFSAHEHLLPSND